MSDDLLLILILVNFAIMLFSLTISVDSLGFIHCIIRVLLVRACFMPWLHSCIYSLFAMCFVPFAFYLVHVANGCVFIARLQIEETVGRGTVGGGTCEWGKPLFRFWEDVHNPLF